MVVIKKYPNRRLYDTSKSQYVNLEYIKELVISNADFTVVDSKTDEDLTKLILLQLISEQESSEQQSLLTNKLLKQLIRFYGSDMQFFLRQYLEQSLNNFLEQQETLHGMMKNMVESTPIGIFGKMMGQNMEAWKKMTGIDKES